MPRATAKPSTRLARKRVKTPASRSSIQAADELMELVVDAAHSRNLPAFLERFAQRATRMVDARWGGVMVFRGRETDLYQARADEDMGELQAAQQATLIRLGREARAEAETLAVSFDPDGQMADVTFVPITASDEESLGCLCLIRRKRAPSLGEKHLLHALASHAALSLENFRRFSQLERSKRQWAEDIDAISDYIVVHDRSFRIVRTNRSLASHLCVPPGALVGDPMSSLGQIAETRSEIPCPFCGDTQQAREEYSVASPERIFLVSTSRTPGVSDDDTRTIHVLKDMTDRREAERRYRELFDSIQEGLFFATPDGRFLDVNDAMVRMLGYESREELLRADVSTHLYPIVAER